MSHTNNKTCTTVTSKHGLTYTSPPHSAPIPSRLPPDPAQWGELFNDLRNWSTGSGQPPSLTGRNSFTTDWIPELLSMKASGRLDQDAAAAAPAGGQASEQQQQEAGPVAVAAAAAAEGGCDVEGVVVEGGKGRSKGKRERSKTNQAPTEQQKQEWQVCGWADGWVDGLGVCRGV